MTMTATMSAPIAEPTPFWIVWSPRGDAPLRRHTDALSAEVEAERMAKCNPGLEFYVLAPVCALRSVDVEITRYVTDCTGRRWIDRHVAGEVRRNSPCRASSMDQTDAGRGR
jgi:hypothetical protein